MASVPARITSALLSAVFHSRFIKNENMSSNAGAAAKNKVSRYKPPKGYTMTRTPCGECFVESLIPEKSGTDTVIFHIHGGSFKIKLIDAYRRLALKYSRAAGGAAVFSVDYRTMPEYIFPSQLDDVMSAWDMLTAKDIKPQNIVVLGDSSGANLVLALAQKLRDSGRPMPKKLICFSLWGDMTACGESYERNCHSDPFYGIARKEKFKDHEAYFRRRPKYTGENDLLDPYLSVSFADFWAFRRQPFSAVRQRWGRATATRLSPMRSAQASMRSSINTTDFSMTFSFFRSCRRAKMCFANLNLY